MASVAINPIRFFCLFNNVFSRKIVLKSSCFHLGTANLTYIHYFLFSAGSKIGLQITWNIFKDRHEPVQSQDYYMVNHLPSYRFAD